MNEVKTEKHNVNQCVKLCEQYMADADGGIPEAVGRIPDENLIRQFRGKTPDGIAKKLAIWRGDILGGLEKRFGGIASVEAGDADNKTAADLAVFFENGSRIDVELKFGSETNSNIGLATFERLFGISLEMPCETRSKWFERVYMSKERTEEDWHRFRKAFYNGRIVLLNRKCEGRALDEEQAGFLVNSILNSSGSPSGNGSRTVKFALKRGRMAMVEPIETKGTWTGTKTKFIANPLKNRLNFVVEDDECRVAFILNWKNTYRKNGIAVPAKYGFGSASLNIFARKKKGSDNGSNEKHRQEI